MATIRKQILIDAAPDAVWDAVRDFGAPHTRFVPGFVTDTQLDGDTRIVTFASGLVQREPLVSCDDEARRLVYTAADSPVGMTHYNASVQVFADGPSGKRVVWLVDLLPDGLAGRFSDAMDLGAAAMKRAFARSDL